MELGIEKFTGIKQFQVGPTQQSGPSVLWNEWPENIKLVKISSLKKHLKPRLFKQAYNWIAVVLMITAVVIFILSVIFYSNVYYYCKF